MSSSNLSEVALGWGEGDATWPFNGQGNIVFGKVKEKIAKINFVTDCFCILYLHLLVSKNNVKCLNITKRKHKAHKNIQLTFIYLVKN